jgi:hypothetical protein
MVESRVLHAHAQREPGGWWTVTIPELTSPGPDGSTIVAIGAAVNPRGIDRAARELAAVWLDVEETEVDVRVTVELPDDVARLWKEGADVDAAGRAEVERGAVMRREAVRELRQRGYTVEAAAAALGISRQRVQQLAG